MADKPRVIFEAQTGKYESLRVVECKPTPILGPDGGLMVERLYKNGMGELYWREVEWGSSEHIRGLEAALKARLGDG
jgi:hypothetical protein